MSLHADEHREDQCRVDECRACGHRVYPARLWCPACGHDESRPVAVDEGELLAWTVMPDKGRAVQPDSGSDSPNPPRSPGLADSGPVIIATVRAVPVGPVLVVRLQAPPSHIGQRLCLFQRQVSGRALPWAEPLPDQTRQADPEACALKPEPKA
ncbi:zinc ribbon domain-containing protein [Achromobacter sp. AGC78]